MDRLRYTVAKELTRLLPLLLLLTTQAKVQAQDFNYTTNNGSITITKYIGLGGAVTIPDTINDLPVTSLGFNAFAHCYGLTSIVIGSNVTTIENEVFEGNYDLTTISLGSGVKVIGQLAFLGCFGLTNIVVNSVNPFFTSEDGILYDKQKTILVNYPEGINGHYIVPNSITNISDFSFNNCTGLTGVMIGNNVANIGDNAFCNCSSLTSVIIPNKVSNIGWASFEDCCGLTNLVIGTGVTSIGGYAFHNCISLISITIPDSVTSIDQDAFSYCTSLTTAVIGNGVTSIKEHTFSYCTSLTSITIGSGVANIGFGIDALLKCTSLTNCAVAVANRYYSSYEGVLFNKSQTTLIEYPKGKAGVYTIPSGVRCFDLPAFEGCANLTGIVFPDSITSIPGGSFANCSGLRSVIIPKSVATIGYQAFFYCCRLTSLVIPDSVTNIETSAFGNCWDLNDIYFRGNAPNVGPDVFMADTKSTVYYLPGTKFWGTSFGGRPAVMWNPQVKSDSSFGMRANGFGFTITNAGTPTIIVEACTNLTNPVWLPAGTNTLTSGSSDFNDSQWTNYPNRFYRFRMP